MAEENSPDNDGGFGSLKNGSTDSDAVEAYYDDWAETYDETLKNWDYQAADDAAELLRTHVAPGDAVLDVGCGTGLFAEALAPYVDCRLIGLDISAASLAIAERRGRYEKLQRHDLQVTPLPVDDDAVDAAACVGVLTYIADIEALLADLCRVVRAGGTLLFTQRDDRWEAAGLDDLMADFERRGLWTPLKVSEPRPYLPNNEDFSDAIHVIHVLCRVG